MDSSKGTFMGHIYRRDWVAKYGKNPKTGEAFTFGYTDPNDKDTWYDDVVFPSWYKEDLKAKYLEIDPSWDGTIPVYLSDWEWMFDIFTTAMKDLGITDGYCYSPYYMGFAETGDLFSGFGGGGPLWYKDREGNAQFGADGDSMLSYLECMNTWYQKGWELAKKIRTMLPESVDLYYQWKTFKIEGSEWGYEEIPIIVPDQRLIQKKKI